MSDEPLEFKLIDLAKHADLCVKFRIDSYVCGAGSAEMFYQQNTSEQGYVDWLRNRMRELPGSCVHLWRGTEIVGQLELGLTRAGPDIGYVNLYYLIPEVRGSGLSERLDEYVRSFYADLRIKRAKLHVGLANSRAIRFYEKHGWKNLGPDPRHPEILLFERTFEID
jgi:GNAT superfamily N-acetyltransferase